jgi:hypothetical protein
MYVTSKYRVHPSACVWLQRYDERCNNTLHTPTEVPQIKIR